MLRSRPAKPIPAGSSFLKHPLAMSKRRLATDAHGCTRIKKEISYPCSSVFIRGSTVFIRGSNWVRFVCTASRPGRALSRTGSAQNGVRFFRSATLRRLAMGPGGCTSIENKIDDPRSSAFIRGSDWVRFVLAEPCGGSAAPDGWRFVRLLCSGDYPKPRSQDSQLAGGRDK